MDYQLKMQGVRHAKEAFTRQRIYRRFSDLMYSRQMTDTQICNILDIKPAFWNLVKRGVVRCPEAVEKALIDVLGEEVPFILLNYYCDKMPLEIKRGDEV